MTGFSCLKAILDWKKNTKAQRRHEVHKGGVFSGEGIVSYLAMTPGFSCLMTGFSCLKAIPDLAMAIGFRNDGRV